MRVGAVEQGSSRGWALGERHARLLVSGARVRAWGGQPQVTDRPMTSDAFVKSETASKPSREAHLWVVRNRFYEVRWPK